MDKWTPAQAGKDFELSEILQPLAPFRDQVCVISNLAHAQVAPWEGEDTGGAENHVRAAAVFLSGAHPVKGDRAFVGATVDQVAARVCRSRYAAALDRALDRGARAQLRSGFHLRVPQHARVEVLDRTAADGEQPADRLRAAVRRR